MHIGMELPVWLGNEEYYKKTKKFLDYYTQPEVMEALGLKSTQDIWLVENASSSYLSDRIFQDYKISIKWYPKHLTRTAQLEYPYCWRGLYYCRDLFQEYDYEKIIHLNNDVFIISPNFANYIRDFKSGWMSPFCPRHNWPECDLQIITPDCNEFWEITGPPYLTHNGIPMEKVIKANCERRWIGDRHSEYGITELPEGLDFSCQVKYDMKVTFGK